MSEMIIHTTVFPYKNKGGNPCPVVLNADDLTAEAMQAMTKEFQHETAFVLRASRSDCDVKLKFFVPLHEMEMCVHATIASITVLLKEGFFTSSSVFVETAAGRVHVEWKNHQGEIVVSVDQFSPQFSDETPSRERVAEALSIESSDISECPVQSVSTSRFKLIVPLKSVDLLHQLEPDFKDLWEICETYNTTGVYVFALEDNHVQARQFPNKAGYIEDPATGVAASALGVYLTEHEIFPPIQEGWNTHTVYQGEAMGRKSLITAETYIKDKQIVHNRITGKAVLH
ncbi:PhzF family phenazine biosynthesis protein [Halobacillus salinarum]|uniref:PhzF family phenazine biosynthesis protein n=1 Tax=Halobacillus salinarum TaxID=2932257 RepID=A0ABY4ELD8_9BACI|nr:PhzF family phenazine biosynthesis isomerase [Halobacillus salinarum]UOQ42911.1 PhzF family phenazine biosynthesis protein [Halobacillus salinarum]